MAVKTVNMMSNWLQRSSGSFFSRRRPQQPTIILSSSWHCASSSHQSNNHQHSSSSHHAHQFSSKAATQQFSPHYSYTTNKSFTTTTATRNNDNTDAPLRRRRRRKPTNSTTTNDNDTNSTTTNDTTPTTTGAYFSPINTQTGTLLTSDQYLALASLSPWVPCPDVVAKRVFEIAMADESDVHVDLGCGDGRLNFMAVDTTTGSGGSGVRRSLGVDVDENILSKCYERLGRRFVPSAAAVGQEEERRLEFVKGDLVKVIECQKELYQQQQQLLQLGVDSSSHAAMNDNDKKHNPSNDTNESLQSITNKISNSTIITMYFVDNALQQIQPYLSSVLGGKKNVRVITIGYEMPSKDGWDASWVERVLGLTIFRYDMENVSKFPSDWSLGGDKDNDDDVSTSNDDTPLLQQGLDRGDNDDAQDVEEFLRRKREQDMEELNRGLRIHHDEELDDFSHARAKQQGSNPISIDDDDDDAWDDFDETEDPKELMKEAQRRVMEDRKASRGKMMAGVRKKNASTGVASKEKKPTWKKP